MAPPEFPPPYIVERTRSLGFGTGPWRREQLVQLWDAPMADKYVGEAKAAGWLVSPSRGVYYVPPVQDLVLVSWLPEPARSEFLISRTLAAADLRYWCLSAWCRDRGLDLGAPVFVTDLAEARSPGATAGIDRRALRDDLTRRAEDRLAVPFLDNLLVVPALPKMGPPRWRLARIAESPRVETRQRAPGRVGLAAGGLVGFVLTAANLEESSAESADLAAGGFRAWRKGAAGPAPASSADVREQRAQDNEARGVPYAVGPEVEDDAWIVALLASLATGRIEQIVADEARSLRPPRRADVLRWAGLLGPPQPVSSWKETLTEGPFPFLLVPPQLWADMGADQAARRFQMLERLGGPRP